MFLLPDPFTPDEMAQHRTAEHCPTCLERKPCACDAEADAREAGEMRATVPEESLPDPELGEVVEAWAEPTPERWEERRDLE
jgi:hypothetical protein